MRATLALLALVLLAPPALAAEVEMEVFLHELEDGKLHLLPPEFNAEVGDTLRMSVRNDGAGAHNLTLCGDKPHPQPTCDEKLGETALIPAGGTLPLVVELKEPGDFEYYCPLPGHKQAGMRGVLHVTGEAQKSLPLAAAPLALAALLLAAVALRRSRP